jgi:hypothetical protein
MGAACFIDAFHALRLKYTGGRDYTKTPRSPSDWYFFPEPSDFQCAEIAEAARDLDQLRNNWLNPPEWTRAETLTFPGSIDGPWARFIDPAIVSKSAIHNRHRPLSAHRPQRRRVS